MILTDWPEFAAVDWKWIGKRMRGRVVFDGRNILVPKTASDAGFHYFSIGRSPVEPVEAVDFGNSDALLPEARMDDVKTA